MAVHAVRGPGKGLQTLRRDRLGARLAQPEGPGLDAFEAALYLDEVELFALAELLAALALGDLGGGSRLGAVGYARVLHFLGEFEADSRPLAFERKSGVLNQLGVHGTHRTPLLRVARGQSDDPIPGTRRGGRQRLGLDSARAFRLDGPSRKDRPAGRRSTMAYAKDPVCGMEVDTSTDLHFEYEGETYYFCSRGCRLEFEDDPEKYLDPDYEPSM